MTLSINKSMIALVLAGGKSSRMGKDKGLLRFRGVEQRYYSYNILKEISVFDKVYISLAKNVELQDNSYEILNDKYDSIGPIAGIFTALELEGVKSVFVIATDMPEFNTEDLKVLLDNYDSKFDAVCYTNNKGFFEPLFCIYNKSILNSLKMNIEQGQYSLNKVLRNSKVKSLKISDENSLININTPQEEEEYLNKKN